MLGVLLALIAIITLSACFVSHTLRSAVAALCLALICGVLAVPANATTYYVDNVGGFDSNDGTSSATA